MKKFIFITLLFISSLAFAQSKMTVKGTIKDSKGEPIIGAVVMLEGSTTAGAATDIDGKYTLTFTPQNGKKPRLVASCISYQTQIAEVAGRGVIDFVLVDDAEVLDEVVVVGYGSMRRSDLTGSVTSVKIDETEAGQSASLDQLLQGRAAGVQVTNNSASPDGGVSIQIRGASSFNGSTEPLYVVDGVIINTSSSTSLMSNSGADNTGADESTNGLMGINPQDIASMEILKDASATAIYGSQGANGVILITTKSANREKPVIRASVGIDLSTPYKKMPMMTFDEYYAYQVAMSKQTLSPDVATSAQSRLSTLNGDSFSTRYDIMDWQDYMMRNALSQRYYVSISGKPKQTNYMFSVGYNNAQGIIKSTGFKNYTIRLNLDRRFGKIISLGTRSSLSYLDSQLTQGASTGRLNAASSLMRSMLTSPPYGSKLDYDEEGDVIDMGDDTNQSGPNRWMQGFVNNKIEYRVNPSIYLQAKILPWLTFKTTFGGDFRVTEQSKFKSQLLTAEASGSSGATTHIDRLAWNWDNTFMFNKKFGKFHNLSGTLGMSMSTNNSMVQTQEGTNIEEWKAKDKSLNSAPYGYFTYSENASSLMSYFVRGIYNYHDRYVLTATFRADGSSKFAGKNKWGFFPSFAFAWRLNQEKWFNVPAISMAKVRLGWGQVGNQAIGSYATIYNYGTGYYPDHGALSQKTVYTSTSNLPNANLKWETTEQTNAGIDFGMFKGRLTLSVDAYYKLTKDLLQTRTLAASAGLSNPYVNMGSIENKGLEFTLDAVAVKTKNFEWSVGGNFSLNRNRIVSINPDGTDNDWVYITPDDRQFVNFFYGDTIGGGNVCKTNLNIFIEGQPMALFYGIPTRGLVQEGNVGVRYAEGDTSYRGPGSVDYIDVNGDGNIDELDRTIIGNPNPDFTYGFNTSLRFKQFSLTATFIGSHGNDIYNVNRMIDTATNGVTTNLYSDVVTKAWTPTNTDTWYPALGALNGPDVKWASDRYIEDGSYLRLSNVALSYNIPIKNKNFFIKGIGLTASVGNLFVWTKYSGWDPDVNSYGSMRKRGADMGSYPGARTYKFDLKFTF